jgi:hypothetical protein
MARRANAKYPHCPLYRHAAKKTYRASADCTKGRISAVDGETYRLDGVWNASDIGAGRTRWRERSGQVIGRDNASGELGISQQWEVLCPGPVKAPQKPAAAPARRASARRYPVSRLGRVEQAGRHFACAMG